MKKIIYLLWLSLSICSWGCSNNNTNTLPEIKPETSGTMTDNEGNEYTWVRHNGLDWMTSNLKCGTPFYKLTSNKQVFIYLDNKDQALAEYDSLGNLYSYEQALANAPEGWRLPTDEDWKKLEEAMGMKASELDKLGWRGSIEGELLQQNETGCGINLLLSGFVSLQERTWNDPYFCQAREFGYYWSSTVNESYTLSRAVYFRRIGFYTSQIERSVSTTEEKNSSGKLYSKYMSVRYVRDAQ